MIQGKPDRDEIRRSVSLYLRSQESSANPFYAATPSILPSLSHTRPMSREKGHQTASSTLDKSSSSNFSPKVSRIQNTSSHGQAPMGRAWRMDHIVSKRQQPRASKDLLPPSHEGYNFPNLVHVHAPPINDRLAAFAHIHMNESSPLQLPAPPSTCQCDVGICLGCGKDHALRHPADTEMSSPTPSPPPSSSEEDNMLDHRETKAAPIKIEPLSRPSPDLSKISGQATCERCGKLFKRQNDLPRHMKTACPYRPIDRNAKRHFCQTPGDFALSEGEA
ncbi:uncharacterized protein MYCFIDRAFT_177892 [Pseudocercospora fijiensis CIRAD86]|uniref:C2H2-type domain-containing protein n=1 Tax=Pseudocercospora fijiensis (strain CIRAD86) TaxID=383855 RepID=M3APB7_PSEFD|nr:uncharacterized protein MYCFIDRAFT_177892 [Pseudocercospora fijiensis CIRAD86]EME79262.1 hypothetical protein MYCFIDRAFT_177892 [Pseudocercospora fijiensis CIRAD86]